MKRKPFKFKNRKDQVRVECTACSGCGYSRKTGSSFGGTPCFICKGTGKVWKNKQ